MKGKKQGATTNMSEGIPEELHAPISEHAPEDIIVKRAEDFQKDLETLAKGYGATIVAAAQFHTVPKGLTIGFASHKEETNSMILLGLATKIHEYVKSEV